MIKIVHSNYYPEITDKLLDSIEKTLNSNTSVDTRTLTKIQVSGVWEIPYIINKHSDECDMFIAVGVVIKGETDHYEYISSGVINALMDITINNNVYIANCILNVLDIEQAKKRSETKGIEAAEALLNIISIS